MSSNASWKPWSGWRFGPEGLIERSLEECVPEGLMIVAWQELPGTTWKKTIRPVGTI
jgi:hypothetical protein